MKRLLFALSLTLVTLACVPSLPSASSSSSTLGIDTDALATDTILMQTLGPADPPANAGSLEIDPSLASAGASEELSQEVVEVPIVAEEEQTQEPKPPSSPEEAACVKKGGLWIHAGKSIAFTCVRITKDSGKQCRRSSECQGSCLARSMTCAPYDPLFGCKEILQDDGSRVTLCID